MINHFTDNFNRCQIVLNGNFKLVGQWINDYSPSTSNNIVDLPSTSRSIIDDEPDIDMLNNALTLLNKDFSSSIKLIYGNLQTIKEWVMT